MLQLSDGIVQTQTQLIHRYAEAGALGLSKRLAPRSLQQASFFFSPSRGVGNTGRSLNLPGVLAVNLEMLLFYISQERDSLTFGSTGFKRTNRTARPRLGRPVL